MTDIPFDTQQPAKPPVRVVGTTPDRSRLRRAVIRVAKTALGIAAGYYALCLVLLLAYRFVSPPITALQLQRRIEATVARREYEPRRTFVPYSRIPQHVSRAVIVAEDGRFWRHHGFDFEEMRNAGMQVFDGEMPRGASTITQQLMKNLFDGTLLRPLFKLFDMALTPPAELILGKERILELYLNHVEWGPGIYGIDAAARHHFGTSARGLSRWQAAGLAALLPNPRYRTPGNTSQYRSEILRRLAVRGW